mgnify:CR=1 FL=1
MQQQNDIARHAQAQRAFNGKQRKLLSTRWVTADHGVTCRESEGTNCHSCSYAFKQKGKIIATICLLPHAQTSQTFLALESASNRPNTGHVSMVCIDFLQKLTLLVD